MKYIAALAILLSSSGFAQTRADQRELEDRSPFNQKTLSLKSGKNREDELKRFNSSNEVGFLEINSKDNDSESVAGKVASNVIFGNSFESAINLKFSCQTENEFYALKYRGKTVTWEIDVKGKKTALKGDSQTDTDGMLKLRLSPIQTLSGKIMTLTIGDQKKTVELGKGPYEIFLPEKSCKHGK